MGNHKYAHLEPNAIAIIDELLQPPVRNRMIYSGYGDELLIPANTRTVSAYFTRACHILEIDGLRFHDLRHEGATRLAEDNWSVPQIQTVTLHSSWKSLQRYVNLKKRPERLDYWDILATLDSKKPSTQPIRHINESDIKNAQIAIDRAIISTPNTPYSTINALLTDFIANFRPSKAVVDGFRQRASIDDVFLFDGLRRQFVIAYTQTAWEKWLLERATEKTWVDMPTGTTHFYIPTLDALRMDGKSVCRFDDKWVEIGAYFEKVGTVIALS